MDYIAFIAGLPEIDWDDRKLSLTVSRISGTIERLYQW